MNQMRLRTLGTCALVFAGLMLILRSWIGTGTGVAAREIGSLVRDWASMLFGFGLASIVLAAALADSADLFGKGDAKTRNRTD